jgi:signal transduction histidine kinase
MQQAYCEGIVVAETASQLVLGVMFCAAYAFTRKRVEWLGFGVGCLGLAAASWSPASLAGQGSPASRFAAMGLAAAMAMGIALIVFGLAWLTKSPKLTRLGWITAIAGVTWQLVLGYLNSPTVSSGQPWLNRPADPGVLAAGWLFLLHMAVHVVAATLLFYRCPVSTRSERWSILGALAFLVLGLFLDGIRVHWFPSVARAFPHTAFAFALALCAVLLLQHRSAFGATWTMEQRLKQCLRELSVSQSNLERVQRELGRQKQLAAVGELAAAIAHEVRNPLAIIMNAAAGLRRPTLGSEDRTTLLSILDEESARLNRLVTDLLRFARPVIIKRSPVSIVELTRRAEGRLEDRYRLNVSVPDRPELKFVQADASLLRLVFDNLVSNALQAMPDGGLVQVVVDEESADDVRFVRIDIIDNGQGMEEQVLARATDPFYTTRPSGTGLGLPIVQRIVEAHGGRMEIESAIGQGTKVSLFLPSVAPEIDAESANAGAATP